VIIRLPAPAHGRTLPKRTPAEDYSSFTVYPQNHETIQELKLAVNEWVGGYWLGPYALRLPKSTKANETAAEDGAKAGPAVKEGESLSEYLEIVEVFGDSEEERILEVVKGMSLKDCVRSATDYDRAILGLYRTSDCLAPSRAHLPRWHLIQQPHLAIGHAGRLDHL
jgi:hypothetical protein